MSRSICIHGHFYQPPRENPWLEEIEVQDSAYPFHDWNERVTAECYAPNAASRILDSRDLIVDIVNNYARISFDAGPTLLTWMEEHSPDVYRAILQADRESRERFGGHGGAMAQAYNHMIMPLANSRDKRTQIVWGLKDFEFRFGRKPEGLWLPETAVDLESLDIMAEKGILFTILAPGQAAAVREIGGGEWMDVRGGRIDPKKPYVCRLSSGRDIALFFYDGPISHEVAFGDILCNGERFARRLTDAFSPSPAGPELVHIATDGETYGHHHRFGDMALAYGLHHIEANKPADLTVYGAYLEKHPPAFEARILENTSWSCGHGLERWRGDCGDNSGTHPGWNQKWRTPLREAMDWLRDRAAAVFEEGLKSMVREPWAARDDYIEVILDRSPRSVESFFARHRTRPLLPPDLTRALKLLEIQRQAMLMFTSDGWFFDDISNIETVQVIQYAARALQLIRDIGGPDLEPEFVRMLDKARSNVPEQESGAGVYERMVKPSVVDALRLGAHYAVSSLFRDYPREIKIAHYHARKETCAQDVLGQRKMAAGRVILKSEITREEQDVVYAALYIDGLNLVAGVKDYIGPEPLETLCRTLREAFSKSDWTGLVRLIDREFEKGRYSLEHLFKDERQAVLHQILESNLRGLEADFRRIFETNRAVMQALKDMQIPLPEALSAPAEFVLNADFRKLLEAEDLDFDRLSRLLDEFQFWSFAPDPVAAHFVAGRKINSLMNRWAARPDDTPALKSVEKILAVLKPLVLGLDLRPCQNVFFRVDRAVFNAAAERFAHGDAAAREWLDSFLAVGRHLGFNPAVFQKP